MNNREYIRLSLELNLFFARIMKEHSFFLEAAFMPSDEEFKKIANDFQKTFSNILEEVTNLANYNISEKLIASDEFITNHTLEAEIQTSKLSGIDINKEITMRQKNLKSGVVEVNSKLLDRISDINRKTLPVIANLIYFKEDVLKRILACKLYTTNYPLLITHITNEAKMYHKLLTKIENRELFDNNYLKEQELFWNNIMKEHAEFIRGLLDPSEDKLIESADDFSKEYEDILKKYKDDSNDLTMESLKETLKFKEFKIAGEEGILNCKIKSIIIPLLADHVVREANHFIRILRNT